MTYLQSILLRRFDIHYTEYKSFPYLENYNKQFADFLIITKDCNHREIQSLTAQVSTKQEVTAKYTEGYEQT